MTLPSAAIGLTSTVPSACTTASCAPFDETAAFWIAAPSDAAPGSQTTSPSSSRQT